MTFELLEDIRLFVSNETRKLKISSQNLQLNGYREVSLQIANEAALGTKILRELSQEYGDIDAKRKTDN